MTIKKICECCKNEFIAQKTTTRYCSHKCNSKQYKLDMRNEKVQDNNSVTKKVKAWQPLNGIDYLTVKEVSTLLRCSIRTIYRLIDNGTIAAVNLSERKTLVRRSDIEKIFDNIIK
jgi:excisionase family DNA binding protein